MNRTLGFTIVVFGICLFLLWRHYHKAKQEQRMILAQLKRYPAVQHAWTAALEDGDPVIEIPGLATGIKASLADAHTVDMCGQMTPQGLALSKDWVFISMYCNDHQHHSQILLFDRHTGAYSKPVILPKKPHVGGLVYDEQQEVLWVTITGSESGRIGGIPLATLLADTSAQTGQPVRFDRRLELLGIARASYLTMDQEKVVAGSFSLRGAGKCAAYSRQFLQDAMAGGSTQKSQMLPNETNSTLTKVQSVAYAKDWLLIARSFGPGASELLAFPKTTANLKRNSAAFRFRFPPYLEQIVVEDQRLYCLFESGAAAYRHKTKWPIDTVLVLDLSTLLHKKTGFKRNRRIKS